MVSLGCPLPPVRVPKSTLELLELGALLGRLESGVEHVAAHPTRRIPRRVEHETLKRPQASELTIVARAHFTSSPNAALMEHPTHATSCPSRH
jgi:hypothetical protein